MGHLFVNSWLSVRSVSLSKECSVSASKETLSLILERKYLSPGGLPSVAGR